MIVIKLTDAKDKTIRNYRGVNKSLRKFSNFYADLDDDLNTLIFFVPLFIFVSKANKKLRYCLKMMKKPFKGPWKRLISCWYCHPYER